MVHFEGEKRRLLHAFAALYSLEDPIQKSIGIKQCFYPFENEPWHFLSGTYYHVNTPISNPIGAINGLFQFPILWVIRMDRYMSLRCYWLQSTKVIYPKTIFNLVCFRMLKFSRLILISFFGYILSCDHTYLKPYWHHQRFILISHPFESFISKDARLCDIIGFKVRRSFIQRLFST
jgi:hypothetical protein